MAILSIASAPPAPVRAASGNASAVIGGFLGALLGGLIAHHIAIGSDVHRQQELLRNQMTIDDENNLKRIATALEEYAVDHNGVYPSQIASLQPLYLPTMSWVPGSDPPAPYRYEIPASRPQWGKWDIVDAGMSDPTLSKLRAPDNNLCTHETCRFIVYAESTGLVGAP